MTTMTSRLIVSAVLMFVLAVPGSFAQYIEIYRIDQIAKEMPEQQVLASLAAELKVPGDVLKQEATEYKLSFGELYVVHQLAAEAKTDMKTLVAEQSSGKTWGVIAKEKNVDMDVIVDRSRAFENVLKMSQNATR